ncbi:MAG: hypothetical protein HY583_01450, partial [Candidatus Omnitrophica bacterium]|nr:hypothetical protein [Candidatus Omnitrophota bacterium]
RGGGDPESLNSRRSDRTPYQPYGTATPSARPALVQAAEPDDRAAVRRLIDWRFRGNDKKFFLAMTIWICFFVSVFALSGCDKATYPEDKIANAIQEICAKEYKIEDVEVKFAGNTIGVFLPLKKLFTTDVRQEILSGQVANLESLFEPEPEAMDQLENVLFTISRVLLSSDKPIDFYVLQATDVELTGLQLILMGYVPDVRRVRLWDISRNEYRKRVLHELKFSRSVLWEKPVRELFEKLPTQAFSDLANQYFLVSLTPEGLSPIFYDFLTTLNNKQNLKIDLQEIKSRPYTNAQALVYVKLRESFEPRAGSFETDFAYPSGTILEYIFIIRPVEQYFKIAQVIPFYYLDETKQLQRIPLPSEFNLDQSLEAWPERFSVEEIKLGEFLAKQLNRRIQGFLLADERIHHTIRHAQVNFDYESSAENPHFSLHFDFLTKGMKQTSRTIDEVISDEDVLYLFNLILREFTEVIRSYRFADYSYLELVWQPGDSSWILKLDPTHLDLFRERKLKIEALLSPSRSLFTPS